MGKLASLISRHRHANWAFLDQSVVSGSNFIIGILLARFLGPEAFGVFVLLQSVMLYVNSFQGALIFQPMMSAAPQLVDQEKSKYLQGVFAMQLILGLMLGLGVTFLAVAAHALGLIHMAGLEPMTVTAVVCAMLAFQLQDWQRRYYFVHEKARAAFVIDIISYGGQVAMLATAFIMQRLDVATGFWIIAVASLSSFCIGFLHHSLRPVFAHARDVLREGWRTGRDYLVAWQFQWLGSQGVFMVGASLVGTHAVGGVRATQNIVGPINILFLAMDNLIPVAAARRYGNSGLDALSKYLWKITLWGTILLAPVLILLAVFAEPLMGLLYGKSYVAFASLVYWQALYIFIQFYLRQTFFFLRTVKATGVILRSGIILAACSIAIASMTVDKYHAEGLMFALLGGVTVSLAYAAWSVRKLAISLRQEGEEPTDFGFDDPQLKKISAGGKA
ncbi:MAG TPA: lipopolysaccharide biosynthesis protein [Methylophilaceae bacterium]|nr:lipopolysaccharide biosynthesis protein [Methylophilaceae bacterium]